VAPDEGHGRILAHWRLAVPLSMALGLTLWLLSDPRWTIAAGIPILVVLISPLTALFLIAFLTLAARRNVQRAALVSVGLAAITAYVVVLASSSNAATRLSYLILMLLHVPLLSGLAVGLVLLGLRASARDNFLFLTKAIEAIGTAGVAIIAGGIFVGLTYGVFEALSVEIPEVLVRLLIAGGGGLIPVLAVATVYNPEVGITAQEYRRGFGRVLSTLMRALLPPALLVLAIYLVVIPFNFAQPFTNRDVLIIYNVLLFAVLALLVGATPIAADDVPARLQAPLRAGILLLAGIVTLVSIYALAAIVYRTTQDHLTMNRFVVIGWNTLNIGILLVLLGQQLRRGPVAWVSALHASFRLGIGLYLVWALLLAIALPWLFS
jgi:hypothetical protein